MSTIAGVAGAAMGIRPTGPEVSTPALYWSTIAHERRAPLKDTFSHDVYSWLVDLDELPKLPRWQRPLGSIRSKDHLGDPTKPIKDNILHFLATQGVSLGPEGGRVVMLATPRTFGYVFNPLTVHWCYHDDGSQVCIVAEVHNTYGDRHCYLLKPDEAGRVEQEKDFYVSPFLTVDGDYVMRLNEPTDRLSITMALRQQGQTVFSATMKGSSAGFTRRSLLHAAVKRPAMPILVSGWIRVHGIKLWSRKLTVVKRPPYSPQEGVQ